MHGQAHHTRWEKTLEKIFPEVSPNHAAKHAIGLLAWLVTAMWFYKTVCKHNLNFIENVIHKYEKFYMIEIDPSDLLCPQVILDKDLWIYWL